MMKYSDNPMLYVTLLSPVVGFATKRMSKKDARALNFAFTLFSFYSALKSRQKKIS